MEHRKMYPAKYAPFIAMKLDEIDAAIAHGRVPEFGLDDVEGDVEVSMGPVETPNPQELEWLEIERGGLTTWDQPWCHACGQLPQSCQCVIPYREMDPLELERLANVDPDLPY